MFRSLKLEVAQNSFLYFDLSDLIVDGLVNDNDYHLLVNFVDCCCYYVVDYCYYFLLLIVVLSSWRRGRLGDGAFDEISEEILGVWSYFKHSYLVCTKSCVHRVIDFIHQFNDACTYGGREWPSGSQHVLAVKVYRNLRWSRFY